MNTEQERADLLPCPFCGSTNIEIQISTPDREGVPTSLMCSDCGASGPWEYEQDNIHAKADAAWNRRAALQSQDAEDPLQPAANWLNKAVIDLTATDIQRRLFVGYNRAQRLLDHARRVEGELCPATKAS